MCNNCTPKVIQSLSTIICHVDKIIVCTIREIIHHKLPLCTMLLFLFILFNYVKQFNNSQTISLVYDVKGKQKGKHIHLSGSNVQPSYNVMYVYHTFRLIVLNCLIHMRLTWKIIWKWNLIDNFIITNRIYPCSYFA